MIFVVAYFFGHHVYCAMLIYLGGINFRYRRTSVTMIRLYCLWDLFLHTARLNDRTENSQVRTALAWLCRFSFFDEELIQRFPQYILPSFKSNLYCSETEPSAQLDLKSDGKILPDLTYSRFRKSPKTFLFGQWDHSAMRIPLLTAL